MEVRSPFAGRIIETFSSEGDEINVGEPLFVIIPVDVEEAAAAPAATAVAPPVKAAVAHAPTPVPSTSQAAQVKTAPVNAPPKAAVAAAPAKAAVPAPVGVLGGRSETRVKMTRMRLRIAQRLKEAQNTTAMLTTFQVRTYIVQLCNHMISL